MINVCLLGATGSIGTQVLDILEKDYQYCLVAFSFGGNLAKAKEIIERFHPVLVAAAKEHQGFELQELYPNIRFVFGAAGLQEVATFHCDHPLVINALVGSVGLLPTMAAIEAGRNVLLANKETLVIGGELVMKRAFEKRVQIIPIDSEHSAIYQLLGSKNMEEVRRIIITASGGAFRDLKREQLCDVTKADALKHPNWQMGEKITIDSATMINKGFEIIEAHHLFQLPLSQIDTILHRESIIHSMVEFKDYSIFAQMASSDMHLPILYALKSPKHSECDIIKPLDIFHISTLHFEPLAEERYPMVALARRSLQLGGVYPTILNASNEAAVQLFLEEKITFLQIEQIVTEALNDVRYVSFQTGELTVTKIMNVDELVKHHIRTKYL